MKAPSPGSFARLYLNKLQYIFHWYEFPNNTNYYLYEMYSVVLRWLPVSSRLILSLALVGLCFSIVRYRQTAPLLLMIAAQVAVILLTFMSARFRLPIVLCSVPLAAWAIVHLYESVRSQRFKSVALQAALTIGVFLLVGRPIPKDLTLIRPYDVEVVLDIHYRPMAHLAESRGDWETVILLWEDLLLRRPERIRELETDPNPKNVREQALARHYADVNAAYAEALLKAERPEEAMAARITSEQLSLAASAAL